MQVWSKSAKNCCIGTSGDLSNLSRSSNFSFGSSFLYNVFSLFMIIPMIIISLSSDFNNCVYILFLRIQVHFLEYRMSILEKIKSAGKKEVLLKKRQRRVWKLSFSTWDSKLLASTFATVNINSSTWSAYFFWIKNCIFRIWKMHVFSRINDHITENLRTYNQELTNFPSISRATKMSSSENKRTPFMKNTSR